MTQYEPVGSVPEGINQQRRGFLGAAAMTIAAAELALMGRAEASKAVPADVPPVTPGAHISFGTLRQIDAGLLNVGYAEAGPADGPVVLLLHGWPYCVFHVIVNAVSTGW